MLNESNDLRLAAGTPWVSDGTAAGTFALQGVGVPMFAGNFVVPATDGQRVWFEGQTGAAGREPWVTDGTQSATQLAADIVPGPGNGLPSNLMLFGDRLAFRTRIAGLDQVWSMPVDGGPVGPLPGLPEPARPIEFQGHEGAVPDLLFVRDVTPGATNVLWATDGTPGGARQLQSPQPLLEVTTPLTEIASDGTVLFGGRTDLLGTELFRTDAEATDVSLAFDFEPGPSSSTPSGFLVAGPRIYIRTFQSSPLQTRLRAIAPIDLVLSSIQQVGQACATSARLTGSGDAVVSGTVTLELSSGAPGAAGAILYGTELLPFGDGAPCGLRIDPRALVRLTALDGNGAGSLDVTLPALPALAGEVVRLQHFEAQTGGPVLGSFFASNVLELVIGG